MDIDTQELAKRFNELSDGHPKRKAVFIRLAASGCSLKIKPYGIFKARGYLRKGKYYTMTLSSITLKNKNEESVAKIPMGRIRSINVDEQDDHLLILTLWD